MNKDYILSNTYRILVVDDDVTIRMLATEALKSYGYHIIDFTSSLDALSYIAGNKSEIDLIILDMVMPEMNGDELFYHIKKINPFIPIIILSGLENVEKEYKSLVDFGLKRILKKPILAHLLNKEVLDVLKENRTIDIDSGLKTLVNKEDLFLKILAIYKEEYQNLSENLTELMKNEKFDDIQKWVHKVKGVSLNIGANNLYQMIHSLHHNLKSNKIEIQEINEIIDYHNLVIRDIERILEAQNV